jgi:hypothetical protein
VASPDAKIYKEDDSLKSNNRMKLVDRAQYRIPVVKPVSSEKAPPVQGVGLLEFSFDDSYLVCRNGTARPTQTTCPTRCGSGTSPRSRSRQSYR